MVCDSIINELKYIVQNLNLKYLNFDLIKSNVDFLFLIFTKIKIEYKKIEKKIETLQIERIKIYSIDNLSIGSLYNKIINQLKKLNFSNNIKNSIFSSIKYINKLEYNNMYLYWFDLDDDNSNIKIAMNLFKIFVSLNEFYKSTKKYDERIIIWLPINAQRQFEFEQINLLTLKNSKKKFGAFIPSGLTFDQNNFISNNKTNFDVNINSKITIISRYEEIEKLLIHELIHNLNMDGNAYYDDLKNIIFQYKSIKPANNFDYEYSIFESYTELSSTYLYLIYKNINLNLNDIEIKNKFFGQILVEIIYSHNIIANLIKLNGYSNYKEFESNQIFKGDICFYEYYYIKALLYNNFLYKFGYNLSDFICIYNNINLIIKKNKKYSNKLMEEIYFYSKKKSTNFKYQIN